MYKFFENNNNIRNKNYSYSYSSQNVLINQNGKIFKGEHKNFRDSAGHINDSRLRTIGNKSIEEHYDSEAFRFVSVLGLQFGAILAVHPKPHFSIDRHYQLEFSFWMPLRQSDSSLWEDSLRYLEVFCIHALIWTFA